MSEDGEHQVFQDKQFSAAGETSNEDQGEGRTDLFNRNNIWCLDS